MKRVFTVAAMLLSIGTLCAQQPGGGISEAMLQEIRSSHTLTQADKAAHNALAQTSIATLAINGENLAMIDTHFSHRVKTKGITDQHQSGRCWLFTGLNVLRAEMIEKIGILQKQKCGRVHGKTLIDGNILYAVIVQTDKITDS